MKEELQQVTANLWQNHRGKTSGVLLGITFGIAILCFGFWKTFFVLCCGLVGLFIGTQLDNDDNVLDSVREKAWTFFERFQR